LHNIRVFQNLILYAIFLGKYHDANDAQSTLNRVYEKRDVTIRWRGDERMNMHEHMVLLRFRALTRR
jgi:hypothetical protein